MKSIILVCLLFAVAFAANCPSYTYKCAAKDGAYTAAIDIFAQVYTFTICSHDQVHGTTTSSTSGNVTTTTGTCYTLLKEGEACDSTGNKNCNTREGLYCPATGTRVCTKNVYGIASGAACDVTVGKYCNNDNYCNGAPGTCTPLKTSGQDCTDGLCAIGLTCGKDSKCVSTYSVAEGGACRFASQDTEECDAGLYCDSTNTCKKPAASSLQACNQTNPSCPTGESCSASCTCTNGVNYCKCEGIQTTTSCVKSNSKSLDSCQNGDKKCVDYASCPHSCISKGCALGECDEEETVDVPTCNNSKCSDATTIATSAILLVAALFIAM